MSAWEPHAHRQAALAAVEARLAVSPEDGELLLARADLLAGLGQAEAAKAAYLALLSRQPDHRAGLNNFGALAHELGYASAARTLYAQAAARYPDDPMSNVNLANSLMQAGETQAATAAFQAALLADPGHAAAHRGLAGLAADEGDPARARQHLRMAFVGEGAMIEQPYRGQGPPIEVLQLISGLSADIPLRHVLDPAVFRVTALAPAFFDPTHALPDHQLVFNAIGDADLCGPALDAASVLLRRSQRPVINPPQRVALTGRAANAARLGALPGVIAAACAELRREVALAAGPEIIANLGLRFPLAARAPGFHTGQHFERIDTADDFAPALARLPGEAVILMNFIDTRGADGLYRKYRAMFVGGEIFPLHLAVSPGWKVHLFTAETAQAFRAEDAAFLADMAGVIGPAAMAGLARVRDLLGLDYGGVDFALSADGALVAFEANATMVVYPPPDDPIWAYRRAPVARVLEAARAMIVARATGPALKSASS